MMMSHLTPWCGKKWYSFLFLFQWLHEDTNLVIVIVPLEIIFILIALVVGSSSRNRSPILFIVRKWHLYGLFQMLSSFQTKMRWVPE
jgi:hypothetical protein